MLLIDSSTIVKFFTKEKGWEETEQYVSTSMTLSLAILELGSALKKKIGRGDMVEGDARELLGKYKLNASLLEDKKYVTTAFELSLLNKSPIYDNIFIAACVMEGLDLVTSDQMQASSARKRGIRTIEC